MIDLENKEERNKLIDDFFNKGLECNIKEVYQAIVNTIADLEYANDEKVKEIERLKEQLNDEIQEELKQSEIMVKKQQEIERLNNIINELDKQNGELGAELSIIKDRVSKTIFFIQNQELHKSKDTTGTITMKERELIDILLGSDKE